jgi:SAM-dependent methyltransferase
MEAALIIGVIVLILVVVVAVVILIFLVMGLTGAPYVPSDRKRAKEALTKLYPLGETDLLVDLGSGDGVILEIATELGAAALGVELNPFLVAYCRRRFKRNKKVKITRKNFYKVKFPKETTVVYVYGNNMHMGGIYRKVKEEARRLEKTIYLVSNGFEVPGAKIEKRRAGFKLYRVDMI